MALPDRVLFDTSAFYALRSATDRFHNRASGAYERLIDREQELESRLHSVPELCPATGYTIRTYRPGDESRFFQLMDLAGWKGWDDERLVHGAA
jgi:predicted nucleic acid-binding protein